MDSDRTALVCQSCNAQVDEHAPVGWVRLVIRFEARRRPPTDGPVVDEIRSMVLCPRCACLVRALYG
jgi:hypothetical protein